MLCRHKLYFPGSNCLIAPDSKQRGTPLKSYISYRDLQASVIIFRRLYARKIQKKNYFPSGNLCRSLLKFSCRDVGEKTGILSTQIFKDFFPNLNTERDGPIKIAQSFLPDFNCNFWNSGSVLLRNHVFLLAKDLLAKIVIEISCMMHAYPNKITKDTGNYTGIETSCCMYIRTWLQRIPATILALRHHAAGISEQDYKG